MRIVIDTDGSENLKININGEDVDIWEFNFSYSKKYGRKIPHLQMESEYMGKRILQTLYAGSFSKYDESYPIKK